MGLPNFVIPNLIFLWLKSPYKISEPRTTLSGWKVCDPERKRRRKIILKIVDTAFRCNAQTHYFIITTVMFIREWFWNYVSNIFLPNKVPYHFVQTMNKSEHKWYRQSKWFVKRMIHDLWQRCEIHWFIFCILLSFIWIISLFRPIR